MNHTDKRWMTWGAFFVLFVAALGWMLWPRPELADIESVTRGPLVVTVDEEGETRVRERFVVSAPVLGRLLRIELEPGDPVVAGETLLAVLQPGTAALLDPRSRAAAEEQIRFAESDLERAKHDHTRNRAELEFAKRESDRARRLAGQGYLADDQREAAELGETRAKESFEASEHAVEGATHRLASARARLLDVRNPGRDGDAPISVFAPVDGVVLRRIRESESVVGVGEALVEIGDVNELEIVADYLSSDAVRIQTGARALIERWGGDGTLEGRVRIVEPSGFTKISALGVEEKRVNVVVDLVTPAAERAGLADGFRVETRIVVWEGEGVVQIPTGSLFRRGENWAAFVVEDGRARVRTLEIDARTPKAVAVASGLSEGENVITHPSDAISDGVRVVARESR